MTRYLLLLLTLITCNAYATDIRNLRKQYEVAAGNEQQVAALLKSIEPYTMLPVYLGYKGALTMMMAEFPWNPVVRYTTFTKGKEMLEQAILADSTNIELIYIRFTVQSNIPAFLNYSSNIPDDKTFLLAHLDAITDADLKQRIVRFLRSSEKLTFQEKLTLQTM
jgi:hypothetical protein